MGYSGNAVTHFLFIIVKNYYYEIQRLGCRSL